MSFVLRDNKGYQEHREICDLCLLGLTHRDGEFSSQSYGELLFALGVGNAQSKGKLAISYSSTGSIGRACWTAMYGKKMIAAHPQATGRKIQLKLNGRIVEIDGRTSVYRITDKGREYLCELLGRADKVLLDRIAIALGKREAVAA